MNEICPQKYIMSKKCDKYYVRYLSLPALDGGEVSHRVQVAALLGPRHIRFSLSKKY